MINYLAIIVAAIAAVVIGALYYGLLGFGDRQSRMLGATPARPGPMQLATGLIVGLVNAWVIGAAFPQPRGIVGRRRDPSRRARMDRVRRDIQGRAGDLRTATVGGLGHPSRSRPGSRSRGGRDRHLMALRAKAFLS